MLRPCSYSPPVRLHPLPHAPTRSSSLLAFKFAFIRVSDPPGPSLAEGGASCQPEESFWRPQASWERD
jgi:hypothetical protein